MNNLPAPAAPSSTTTSILAEIIALHSGIIATARTTLDKAIRLGELLVEQKAKLRHGEWLPWVKENLPFTDQTARRYMGVFSRKDEIQHIVDFELTDAYRLLCEPEADARRPRKAKSIRGATIDVESSVTPGAATGHPCAPPPSIERIVGLGQHFGVEPELEVMKPEPMLSTDREAVANSFRDWLNQWRDVPEVRKIVSDLLGRAA